MNFLVFVVTGILSPFISRLIAPSSDAPPTLHEFQVAFLPLVCGMALAIVLSFIIRETGSARKSAKHEIMLLRSQDPSNGEPKLATVVKRKSERESM
jgi:hypothetical protein